jgi:TetR/AcrR family transcriptional regulator, transcriptional repressor of bet genes
MAPDWTVVKHFSDTCPDCFDRATVRPVTETVRRDPALKFEAKRRELALATLATLGELGYSRTSLREVAQRSEYSHGVLHYYFADRNELITYAVQLYKLECCTLFDEAIAGAESAEDVVRLFGSCLALAIQQDAPMHMLWYDVKSQSMFEEPLQETVMTVEGWLADMVWRVLARYAELAGLPVRMGREMAYHTLDGVFYNALYRWRNDVPDALPQLEEQVYEMVTRAMVPAPDAEGEVVSARV